MFLAIEINFEPVQTFRLGNGTYLHGRFYNEHRRDGLEGPCYNTVVNFNNSKSLRGEEKLSKTKRPNFGQGVCVTPHRKMQY